MTDKADKTKYGQLHDRSMPQNHFIPTKPMLARRAREKARESSIDQQLAPIPMNIRQSETESQQSRSFPNDRQENFSMHYPYRIPSVTPKISFTSPDNRQTIFPDLNIQVIEKKTISHRWSQSFVQPHRTPRRLPSLTSNSLSITYSNPPIIPVLHSSKRLSILPSKSPSQVKMPLVSKEKSSNERYRSVEWTWPVRCDAVESISVMIIVIWSFSRA